MPVTGLVVCRMKLPSGPWTSCRGWGCEGTTEAGALSLRPGAIEVTGAEN